MSVKRGMSKQQRLYHEYNNREKVKEELEELVKDSKEISDRTERFTSFDPHRTSYYNWYKYKDKNKFSKQLWQYHHPDH